MFVISNCRDFYHFDLFDSIYSSPISSFRILILHSDQSNYVIFLSNSKMFKSLIEWILYFSVFCMVDSVLLLRKMILLLFFVLLWVKCCRATSYID